MANRIICLPTYYNLHCQVQIISVSNQPRSDICHSFSSQKKTYLVIWQCNWLNSRMGTQYVRGRAWKLIFGLFWVNHWLYSHGMEPPAVKFPWGDDRQLPVWNSHGATTGKPAVEFPRSDDKLCYFADHVDTAFSASPVQRGASSPMKGVQEYSSPFSLFFPQLLPGCIHQ